MNYQDHYRRLMERAPCRHLGGYVERHHVVPRCLGGNDATENLVQLTPEEHYVAHQLLVKMHPEHMGLLWAATAMTNGTRRQRRSNKLYGWLRRRFAERISARNRGHVVSVESREKMRQAHLGRVNGPHLAETKAKMSAASLGRKKSPEHCAAIGVAKRGKKQGPHSEAHRQALAASLRRSDKHKASVRAFSSDETYKALQSKRMTDVWARRKASQLFLSLGG